MTVKKLLLQYLVFHAIFICECRITKTSLQQVHVIFRHGDRTPDQISMYPKDPHINDTWYPEGYGALTNKGKMQEYKIGQTLRGVYDEFLGKIYTPDVLDAWSTDTNRTKMSLELVLAGLWPPAPSQQWNALLPWQPIPYNYRPTSEDQMMKFPIIYCKNYLEAYAEVEELEEFQNYWTANTDIIKYINENSGLEIKNTFDLFLLYVGLYAEEKTGRELPEWTKKVYPEFLEDAAVTSYIMQTYNDVLLQATGGRLVKQVIDHAKAKIDGTLVPKDRKLYLYSGHEYNVAHVLAALKVFKPHVPPYASYVVFELHKFGEEYGIQVLYQNYEQKMPVVMIMPGCDSICPIDKFEELTAGVMPQQEEC